MSKPLKPTVTITTANGNVSPLRTRIVRERLKSDGLGGAVLVREVIEAAPSSSVMALTIEVGEGGELL